MKKKLLWNLVSNDLKKNPVMSTVLTILLVLSALLMAGGLRVTGTMLAAVNGMNEIAQMPDYLKMHKGSYDEAFVKEFNNSHAYIEKALVVSMLNINNANLSYKGETMEKCLMDNGFVIQNEGFDYLLNLENQIAAVNPGEIGVPVFYAQEMGIQAGDSILIKDGSYQKELTVATLIRDAQMNSALTSSKRFLIAAQDLAEISEHTGEWEYSFEYILKPGTDTAVLEKDYIEAEMPSNGVAITGGLISMLNTMSYGITALLILLISILLTVIALLCLSYIIKATLVEENQSIGTMKAIGLDSEDINRLYLMKYVVLAIAAGITGYLAAIPFGKICSASVSLYCGEGEEQWMQWIFPLIGEMILCLIVILKCRKTIRKNLKGTVLELLRGEENRKREGHFKLPMKGWKHRNWIMAMGDLHCKWKEYIVLFLVFAASAFLILLPLNMKNTINNPSFITYMGVGQCDIRIDIGHGEAMGEQMEQLLTYLKTDSEISQYSVYENGYIQIQNNEQEWEYIRTTSGDQRAFPLQYLEGTYPGENEIALSYMEAGQCNKKTGDRVVVKADGKEMLYTISGIYQDITYGGKTAKANIDFSEEGLEGFIVYLNVTPGISIDKKAVSLREILPANKVTPIREFVAQTLSGITGNMETIIRAAVALSLLLIILISTMFLQLVIAKEHSAIAIKRSLGFTTPDIRMQYGIRILLIQILGIITGTVLANTLGETLFGCILSSMGTARITLLLNPMEAYLMCPGIQLSAGIITIIAATSAVKKYHIRNQIME